MPPEAGLAEVADAGGDGPGASSGMNTEVSIWDFDGETYRSERDRVRLSRQLIAVREVLSDNGLFGNDYPDSLWKMPAPELVRSTRDRFYRLWRARKPKAAS